MSLELTKSTIKSLCGQISYHKGEAYYQDGKVNITKYDPNKPLYKATLKGMNSFEVTVQFDRHGDVDAECTCPKLGSYHYYCQHIAAVLLNIHELQQDNHPLFSVAAPEGDVQLAEGMIQLFVESPQRSRNQRYIMDTRVLLDVEFTCRPISYGYRKFMFGMEMKVGPKRLYIVDQIREFLDQMDRGETFALTKTFTYDPELHHFQTESDVVIRQLIQIYQNEKLYRETTKVDPVHSTSRVLLIPPYAWEAFLQTLLRAPKVKLEQGEHCYDGLCLSDEAIPLRFDFDQTGEAGYRLDVQGLDKMMIMESYGMVLADGKLFRVQTDACRRLAELKQMLEVSSKDQIRISQEHIEPFMEKVIPGLMKLGAIRIASSVSDRIVRTPLKAKLYLDRVKERLLAGLEFHYGDIVINPLEGYREKRGHDRILMRDGEKERRILELMDQALFNKTESGYFMHDEEAQYDFLYHIVPQLEKLMAVYATSAVKLRLYTGHAAPKVTVDVAADRIDWLEFRFNMAGIADSEVQHVLGSLEEKRKYHRLPNGSLVPLETKEFQEIAGMLNDIGIRKVEVVGTAFRLPLIQGLSLMDVGKQGNAIKLGKAFRLILENMRNPDNLDFPVPEHLEVILRDYQKDGFNWLKTLAYYRFGGILADDMGLGKTLQSITFIVSNLSEIRDQEQPALIVAPASLVYNWKNELTKFAPEIRAVIADGSKVERKRILETANQSDVIITSYPLLRRDIGSYREAVFHTLILDEAQVFKNHSTQTAKAVKQLQAGYRFALSGTPVENRLEELWSIFDVVFPDLFQGRKAFHGLSREIVAKRARPFLLRRLKTDVLKELPDKIESVQASELQPDQKKLYVAYLAELQQETVKHLNQGFDKNRIKILAGLTRLRQLCCHPALFVEGYKGSSAKFEQLLEILVECRSAGKRVLVFSQFTQMLALIGLELGYQGVPYFYLDGSTPNAERVELCDRFNEGGRDLFLISLKAGGTGLNLTGADTVILYDLWWNPAVEEQATDRAHRIGQKNVVQVIRLISQGTVEEKMYELQHKKKNLIEEVIQPGQQELSSLTEQEIREILNLDKS